jgi:DNA repair protein RadD
MIFELRDYQQKGKADIGDFLFNSSHRKGLKVNPVGTGKSLDTAIVADLAETPVLCIQPNAELLEQNLEKARAFGFDPSIYSASLGSKTISRLTYATPMSIASKPEDFKEFKTVVVDEAHLNMTNSMKGGKVKDKGKLNEFLEYIQPDKILGLTASPIQTVTNGMGTENKIITRSMRSFWYKSEIFHVTQIPDIQEQYWADIVTDIIDNDTSLLKRKRFNSPEFDPESIVKQYNANNLENQILEQYENLMSQGIDNTLTFVPSVEQAIALQKKNKNFEVVHEKTPKKERRAIVEAFKRGEITNLLNCMIFTAGFDHPELKALIMARETMSFQLYYQIYGRLVRNIFKDGILHKKTGTLVDLTGNTNRFGGLTNLTFEKNDYTNGWAMWNNDRLLTGHPIGDWEMPHRSKFIGVPVISNREVIQDYVLSFGKYKDKNLVKTFEKDPRYFVWVLENFKWTDYNKGLKESIEKLVQKNIMYGK